MVEGQTVLFLCTGNTCRSPLAEAIARQRFGDSGTRFLSAGLHATLGQPASGGTRRAAAGHGASCEMHESRPLSAELLADVDWVVAMTWTHVEGFCGRFADWKGQVGLLGAPGIDLRKAAKAPDFEEVDDPFGGDDVVYEYMAAQVARLLEGWRGVFAG